MSRVVLYLCPSLSLPPSLTDIDTLLGDRFTSAAFLNSHVRNIEERPIE